MYLVLTIHFTRTSYSPLASRSLLKPCFSMLPSGQNLWQALCQSKGKSEWADGLVGIYHSGGPNTRFIRLFVISLFIFPDSPDNVVHIEFARQRCCFWIYTVQNGLLIISTCFIHPYKKCPRGIVDARYELIFTPQEGNKIYSHVIHWRWWKHVHRV